MESGNRRKTIRRISRYLLVVVVALALGVGSAALGVNFITQKDLIGNGGWYTGLTYGSEQAGMYTRAAVAIEALFALNKSEVIYYTADTDDAGQLLQSSCDYRIEGTNLDPYSSWWSITVYGGDNFLIPNEQNRYSYTNKNIEYDENGNFTILLSSTPKTGNWLPTGNQNKIILMLRMYNPVPSVYENLDTIELPHITKEGCK
jgi:hypothetical protein